MTITLDKLARHRSATLVHVDGYQDTSSPGEGTDADPARGGADHGAGPGRGPEQPSTPDQPRRDMARRLVELGFVPGERVRVLRRGLLFGDPIAVKIGTLTLALRRFEAALVTVAPDSP